MPQLRVTKTERGVQVLSKRAMRRKETGLRRWARELKNGSPGPLWTHTVCLGLLSILTESVSFSLNSEKEL